MHDLGRMRLSTTEVSEARDWVAERKPSAIRKASTPFVDQLERNAHG